MKSKYTEEHLLADRLQQQERARKIKQSLNKDIEDFFKNGGKVKNYGGDGK